MSQIFRKELREFIFNYKSWIGVAIVSIVPYFFAYFHRELDISVFLCLVLMALCQYLFNSYLTDTVSGGAVFFCNAGMGFVRPFVGKLIFAMVGVVLIVLVNIPFVHVHLEIKDIVWLVPLCVASNSWMLLTVVIARGSEMASGILSTGIIFIGVFALFLLDSIWVRAGVTMAAAIILVRLVYRSFNSLRYRTQL